MGIPGLTTHLKSYALPTVVGCKTPDCEHHRSPNGILSNNIIIDGPSFAYAIYRRLIAHKPDWLTAVEAIPSYNELGQGALAFLDQLEHYGLTVQNIYFDGSLPTHKRGVRIDRLQNTLQKLFSYHTVSQKIVHCKRKSDLQPLHPAVVFKSRLPTLPAARGIPPAPFIVPAVLDAISSSKYAKVTSVVPGEAEVYCASVARKTGGIILSNDSDLYVHDLGLGTFVYLDSVQMPSSNDEQQDVNLEACKTIELDLKNPQDIAIRLGLRNLRDLAYQLTSGYSQTLPEAIKASENRQAFDQVSFDDFAEEYGTEPYISESRRFSPQALARLRTPSQFIDPRIFELICQLESKASHTAEAYLLSLIEDPTRSSAWLVSSGQRTFAYSICVISLKSTSGGAKVTIEEHNRRGRDFVMQGVSLLTEPETIAYASILQNRLHTFATTFSEIPSNLIWRLYALFEVYQWHLNASRPSPTRELLKSVLAGEVHPHLTWETIHLSAQIQAVLYSLRMIHQILIYIASASAQPLPVTLQELATTLEPLPPLPQLMPSPFELSTQTAVLDIQNVMHRLATLLQEEAGNTESSPPLSNEDLLAQPHLSVEARRTEKKRKKSKKKKGRRLNPQNSTTAKSDNMFSLLM